MIILGTISNIANTESIDSVTCDLVSEKYSDSEKVFHSSEKAVGYTDSNTKIQ